MRQLGSSNIKYCLSVTARLSRGGLFLLLVLLLFSACKNSRPSGVLSESKMANLLYDYHVALALGQSNSDSADIDTRLYTDAVLRKYDLTQADFDRSMEYYSRHSDALLAVYRRVNARFGTMENAGGAAVPGSDGVNHWRGASGYLLSSAANNRMTFSQPADTAFHAGDQLTWSFESHWVGREGERTAFAVLYVRYVGDSIATYSAPVLGDGHQQLSLTLASRAVKQIDGFVLLQPASSPAIIQKMMLLSPRLARVPASASTSASESSRPAEPVSDTTFHSLDEASTSSPAYGPSKRYVRP